MDLFEEYLSPAALPGNTVFVRPDPPAGEPSQQQFIFHEVPSGEPGVREAKRRLWDLMKPSIKRVYIDEDKTFPEVAEILQDEYNFKPTKRQFSRRVKEWGFRKNVPSSERRNILQKLAGGMNEEVSELQDSRVKVAKLENWKRRYRGDLSEGSSNSPQKADKEDFDLDDSKRNSDTESESHISGAERTIATPGFPIADAESPFPRPFSSFNEANPLDSLQSQRSPIAASVRKDSNNATLLLEPGPDNVLPMEICGNPLPCDWSTMGIPDSPGFTRLFKGLEIASADIPALSLAEPKFEDKSCLSIREIEECLHGKSERSHKRSHHYPYRKQRHATALDTTPRRKQPQHPWRDIDTVFCGYDPDPLIEIYVFPQVQSHNNSRKLSNFMVLAREDLQLEERELNTKLAKLRKVSKKDSSALVAVMNDLAFVLYELMKYREAESIYRKLVDIYRQTLEAPNIKFLEVCQRVVESLSRQGQYSKAKELNDDLRPAINRLVQPHHPLAIRATRNDARLAEGLFLNGESEKIGRELLQITLVAYGPRNQNTIAAISSLGHTMAYGRKGKSDALLRTAVQLSLEKPNELFDISCWAMDDLALLLEENGDREGSYNIATKAVEQFSPTLGPTNRHIINLEHQRARNMPKKGTKDLVECEKLYRYLVSVYSTFEVEVHQESLIDAWDGLAGILADMGQMDEACGWYEEEFQMLFPQDAVSISKLMETSRKLSFCYEAQGRLKDALGVYYRMIGKICDCGEDQYSMIAACESQISRIEEQIEQRTRNF